MHAVWVLLCKTQYAAELVKSSKETGVQSANIPFDIYAELVPELLRGPAEALAREAPERAPVDAAFTDILHRSKEMQEVIHMAQRVAVWPVHVLIEGDSGTGKELFARAIHQASTRRNQSFIPLNCGAIPKDMVEAELFGYAKGAFTGATSAHGGAFVQQTWGSAAKTRPTSAGRAAAAPRHPWSLSQRRGAACTELSPKLLRAFVSCKH
jgi:DNA-binding NtrC family response regulator